MFLSQFWLQNKQLFNHINEGNRYTFSGSETQGTELFVSVECLQVQHSKRNSACGKTLRNRRLLSQAQTLGANYSLCEPQEHSWMTADLRTARSFRSFSVALVWVNWISSNLQPLYFVSRKLITLLFNTFRSQLFWKLLLRNKLNRSWAMAISSRWSCGQDSWLSPARPGFDSWSGNSIGGSMIEFSPATLEDQIRFPANAQTLCMPCLKHHFARGNSVCTTKRRVVVVASAVS